MARRQGHYTLSEDTLNYLNEFDNKSATIDEAINLHKTIKKGPIKEPKIIVSDI